MLKILLVFICCTTLCSCTINFTIAHTQGYASDVVDDTTEQKVDPTLSIPLKAM